jgi:hypothetical protein
MKRKVLDTEEIEDLKKKETIRYFMRLVEEEPEEHDEFFDSILTNEYFKIKIDLNRLLKLLKSLIADKSTDVRLLENEIFASEKLAFVDSTKGKTVKKETGDLFIRTNFTPKHREETVKNQITLYTNFFKVKLNPENPTHSVFMKKMIDMRSSPILKKGEGNESETNIKTFIEILKLTFNMKSKLNFDELANTGNVYSFGKMIKSEAPSLSRQVSGASVVSTASSIRDTKSDFFENVEKLNAKKYDFYKENINYFTQLLLRKTEQGLAVYKDWYEEFVESSYFEEVYLLADNFKTYMDKYMFDSAIEDLIDDLVEEGVDGDPDVILLKVQTIIPNKQIEDIEKGNILFLTKEICLTLSLENDIEFLEDLPLMYPKDLYETPSKIRLFKELMKQIYLKDPVVEDDEIDSDVEESDTKKKDDTKENKEKYFYSNLSIKTKKTLYEYIDFVKDSYEVILEENPNLELGTTRFYELLVETYSANNIQFKIFANSNEDESIILTEAVFNYATLAPEEILKQAFIYEESDDEEETFYDKLSSKMRKTLLKYIDFVRSNYEVILQENPKLEVDDDEFYEKLIELYSVVNIQFKNFAESNKDYIMGLTEYMLNNDEKTPEKILKRAFGKEESDDEESD